MVTTCLYPVLLRTVLSVPECNRAHTQDLPHCLRQGILCERDFKASSAWSTRVPCHAPLRSRSCETISLASCKEPIPQLACTVCSGLAVGISVCPAPRVPHCRCKCFRGVDSLQHVVSGFLQQLPDYPAQPYCIFPELAPIAPVSRQYSRKRDTPKRRPLPAVRGSAH